MALNIYLLKEMSMLKMKFIGKTLLFGTLCGASFGCGDSRSTATRSKPLTGEPLTGETVTGEPLAGETVTVTSNKPVSPDLSSSTTSADNDRRDVNITDSRTNTGVNVRDRDGTTKTPFDQNENKTDIRITADIRSRVVATEMSIDAQNVKIITQDGKVTLRGPVHTADEKSQIEQIARDVAGEDNVNSQLEVASN
jgi:hypothetical protein